MLVSRASRFFTTNADKLGLRIRLGFARTYFVQIFHQRLQRWRSHKGHKISLVLENVKRFFTFRRFFKEVD